jgi:hypothetical protein
VVELLLVNARRWMKNAFASKAVAFSHTFTMKGYEKSCLAICVITGMRITYI